MHWISGNSIRFYAMHAAVDYLRRAQTLPFCRTTWTLTQPRCILSNAMTFSASVILVVWFVCSVYCVRMRVCGVDIASDVELLLHGEWCDNAQKSNRWADLLGRATSTRSPAIGFPQEGLGNKWSGSGKSVSPEHITNHEMSSLLTVNELYGQCAVRSKAACIWCSRNVSCLMQSLETFCSTRGTRRRLMDVVLLPRRKVLLGPNNI